MTLNEMLAPEMATAIRDRRADIGFVRPALPESDDLLQKLLLSEPLVLAVPEQHAIAKKKSVPINVVDRERLILYPRHPRPSITNVVLRACDAAGVEPTIVQEVLHVQTAMTLVSAGIGMTFVAHSVTSQERKGLVFVRIEEPAPVADLSLVWRAGVSSPTLRNFLSICDEERSAHRAD